MLHLRTLLHTSYLPTTPLSPLFYLHRLLATVAPAPPNLFDAADYLVTTWGLTRAQARKASKKLSHLKSPSRPDSVLSFLSTLGVSRSATAAIVVADPQLLCADVENNLAKRVVELTDLGLKSSQISRLIPLARATFRNCSLARNLSFWLPVFGSFNKLLRAVKLNCGILGVDLEKVAKPNLALLQQCGISAQDLGGTFIIRVLTRLPEHVQDAVAYIEKIGVPRNSRMFHYALMAFAVQSQEKLNKKIKTLEMLGWSHDDVLTAVKTMPGILTMSEERLRRNVDFLTKDVGLDIPYIARRPVIAMYSLERRLLPRYSFLKVLKARGLRTADMDFYSLAALTEKKFLNKFVHPYEKSFPGLAVTYTSSVGNVPNGPDT